MLSTILHGLVNVKPATLSASNDNCSLIIRGPFDKSFIGCVNSTIRYTLSTITLKRCLLSLQNLSKWKSILGANSEMH